MGERQEEDNKAAEEVHYNVWLGERKNERRGWWWLVERLKIESNEELDFYIGFIWRRRGMRNLKFPTISRMRNILLEAMGMRTTIKSLPESDAEKRGYKPRRKLLYYLDWLPKE
jgi:hypothetical protein